MTPTALTSKPGEPLIAPPDEYNRQLLANVHPAGWVNPTPKPRYHLVVIGAGTGGLVSAAAAAALGAKVALIERHLMGGDCLNVGCVPSKGILRAARAWHEASAGRQEFGGPATAGGGDFGRVMERMRRLRATLSPLDSAERFRQLGVDVFLGEGRFVAPDRAEVGGQVLNFLRAIVATGARAAIPAIPGLASIGYLTNETIFAITELPKRLLVIGAGPIGCEMAQAFARFGSEVTVANVASRILPREDADAAQVVERSLVRDGVVFRHGVTVARAERHGEQRALILSESGREERLTGDAILVAVGRVPNVEGLGLEAAGVKYGPTGVEVDDRLRTSNRRVWAVGDVASKYHFTHNSDAQARIAIQNALFFGRAKASALVLPWATYTSPEVAHVGMYERDARDAGYAVDTLTVPLRDVDRAVLDGEADGFFRVHLRRGTDRILGATLVAEHAGELISEIGVAMVNKIGLRGIGKTIHPYPTQAEVFRKAADIWRRGKLTPKAKRVLDLYFRILG